MRMTRWYWGWRYTRSIRTTRVFCMASLTTTPSRVLRSPTAYPFAFFFGLALAAAFAALAGLAAFVALAGLAVFLTWAALRAGSATPVATRRAAAATAAGPAPPSPLDPSAPAPAPPAAPARDRSVR